MFFIIFIARGVTILQVTILVIKKCFDNLEKKELD